MCYSLSSTTLGSAPIYFGRYVELQRALGCWFPWAPISTTTLPSSSLTTALHPISPILIDLSILMYNSPIQVFSSYNKKHHHVVQTTYDTLNISPFKLYQRIVSCNNYFSNIYPWWYVLWCAPFVVENTLFLSLLDCVKKTLNGSFSASTLNPLAIPLSIFHRVNFTLILYHALYINFIHTLLAYSYL